MVLLAPMQLQARAPRIILGAFWMLPNINCAILKHRQYKNLLKKEQHEVHTAALLLIRTFCLPLWSFTLPRITDAGYGPWSGNNYAATIAYMYIECNIGLCINRVTPLSVVPPAVLRGLCQ